MQRKLVQQGEATLMVSLPRSWVQKSRLKKGDEITITETGDTLMLSKHSTSEKRTVACDISNYTESAIRTKIVNLYRSGFDSIQIQFKDDQQYKIILNVIRTYLIGFDITKKEDDNCQIENITEPSEEQFDAIFKKILYTISLLLEGTEARLRGTTKFEDYAEMVLSIHRYDNFCRRVISKNNSYGDDAKLFWSFSGILIHGQRELYHLNKFLDSNNIQFKDFSFFTGLKTVFNLLRDGYLKKDIVALEELHKLEKKLIYKDFYSLIQKNRKENIVLYHLAVSLKNFYLASSPLMGLLVSSSASK